MKIDELNHLDNEQASHHFMQCCTSSSWVRRMVQSRPFVDVDQVSVKGNLYWQNLEEADYIEAFEGHPKIGNVDSLRAKYANTKALASGEQQLVKQASEDTLVALNKGNTDYENKFGFIFIVCATGKSAEEMLTLLNQRIGNDRDTELRNAAEEQRKILQIRLDKLLQKH